MRGFVGLVICLLWSAMLCQSASAEKISCTFGGENGAPTSRQEWRIFLLHKNSKSFDQIDTNCDGTLSTKETAAFAKQQEAAIELPLHHIDTQSAQFPVKVDETGELKPNILAPLTPDPVECAPGVAAYLRESFEDISIFKCPKSPREASGATIAWSEDNILDDASWNAKGVGFLSFRQIFNSAGSSSYISSYTFAPAVSFNRVTHSAASKKSSEVDILSFSATAEAGFGNTLGGTQYVRGRIAYNTDFDTNPKSWTATTEWQPVIKELSLSYPFSIGDKIVARFDPILRMQYDSQLEGAPLPLFDHRHDALRLGPVLAFNASGVDDERLAPWWLRKTTLGLRYTWLRDLLSGRSYDLFTGDLSYALDPDGHIAVKASYSTGEVQETGQDIDLSKVGLSLKW